jgi:urease accessory protein
VSSAGSTTTFCSPPDRVGRDGALRLRFERRGTATVLAACRSTLPLQVLAPVGLDDPAAVVSVLNPTGGLVGGDRLAIEVVVGTGAHAVLTTPSATKVYRTGGEPAVQDVLIRLEPGATVEYVPDHTIPFAGSALRQAIGVEVGEGARLVLVDSFAAGRVGRGETWRFDRLESALLIEDAGGRLLRDRFVLRGDPAWGGLGGTESHPYFATVALVGVVADARFEAEVAALAKGRSDVRIGGEALPRGGYLLRCLALDAPAFTEAVEGIWTAARCLLGARPLALRKL